MEESWHTDAATMAAIAAGDDAAFAAVHAKLYPGLVRLSTSILADSEGARDVVQDAFVALWRQAPRWEPRATIKTWMWKITLRACLSLRRRLQRSFWAPAVSAPSSPDDVVAAHEAALMLRDLLGRLNRRERAIVTLHLDEERSSHEIAALLEMSEGACRTALSRALAKVKAQAPTWSASVTTPSPPPVEGPQEPVYAPPTSRER